MNYGFVKVAAGIPTVKVADCRYNATQLEELITQAEAQGVRIISFPEMSLTAYTCADLYAQQLLIEEAEKALFQLIEKTRKMDIISIVGMPVAVSASLANAAVVFQHGKILGVVPKTYLPNYGEFSEMRWFSSALQLKENTIRLCGQQVPFGTNLVFDTPETTFGIELCEDVWAAIPPSTLLALKGAEIIFNLSADNEGMGKHAYLHSMIGQQSARTLSAYVFASSGFGESTTDVVFAGNALIYENGTCLACSERFAMNNQLVVSEIDIDHLRGDRQTNTTFAANRTVWVKEPAQHIATHLTELREISLTRKINAHPFIPAANQLQKGCEQVFAIQVNGLAKRMLHTHCQTAVIGISGGLDSTLALLVCIKTFDKLGLPRKGIIGITMPGFGTTDRTYQNAISLMNSLGITIREISIKQACIQHFNDIGHDMNIHNVTYENSQARERTQILMDVANQVNGLVIGTGDLSELALGWATYNGDHMSNYGVNAGVPKTLVRHLVEWVAHNEVDATSRETLLDIVDTPISPELIPADEVGNIKQKTEDLVGPYELHDFFIYHFMRYGSRPAKIHYLARLAFEGKYSDAVIKKWLTTFFRRFFNQQFKRSCLPDGPMIGSVSLSPRGSWHMPSDASSALWLDECEQLPE